MALRSGYKGIKKLASGLKWNRPGILAADDTALAKVFFPRSEQAVLGAKNLYSIKFSEVKATNLSGTWNENIYTINGGTVAVTVDNSGYVTGFTVNGTFSADSNMGMNAFDKIKQVPKDGSYILNGVNGGSASTYSLKMNYKPSASGSEIGLVDVYNGDSTPKTINSAWLLKIYLIIKAGTYSDVTIRPMLRLASDPDSTYAPYTMTNKELTEKMQGIIDAATNAADFAAFKTAIGNL